MNISTQIYALANQILEQHNAARATGKVLSINVNELLGTLQRIAVDVNELELRSRERSVGLGSEYLEAALTRARWILSNETSSPVIRELAETVLVLAGRANPS